MRDSLTIAVNNENDIYLVNGDIATVDSTEAKAQIISAILNTRRGELQLDTERGIPYFETVFDSPSNVQLWRAYCMKAVTELEFVSSILSFDHEIDYSRSMLRYSMRIKLDTGEEISIES